MKREPGGIRLSASDLMRFTSCAHASALDLQYLAGSDLEPTENSEDALLLQRQGDAHEASYLATQRSLGGVVEIDKGQLFDAAVASTRAALSTGARVIFQGALDGGGAALSWGGWSDFLEKVETPSGLGDFSYEVADTKLKRKPDPKHLLQLVLYSDLLTPLQGRAAERTHVILGDGKRATFRLSEYSAYARGSRERLESFVTSPWPTRPAPCAACALCRWRDHCASVWESGDSLYRVAGITRSQVSKLEAADVGTMTKLAAYQGRVPRLADATLDRLRSQARLQTDRPTRGPHHVLRPPVGGKGFDLLWRPDAGDLFYDIEGDPFYSEAGADGLEYLHGVWDGQTFAAIWAHNYDAERSALIKLLEMFDARLKAHPGAHIYHYAPYEITALRKLCTRYGIGEALLDRWLRERRFCDLYAVVRGGITASERSYSIKDMEALYGFQRTGDVKTAGDSVVAYEAWRETGGEEILARIESYNRLDCISTQALRDWLIKQRPDVPWPALAPPQDEKHDERDASAEALRLRLLKAGLPDGRGALLFDLAQFHQREGKPAAWAVFDAAAKLSDDLCEDMDCIGGLVATGPAEPEKKSTKRTYNYPPQETKLRAGKDACLLLGDKIATIDVIAMDRRSRHVTVKLGPKAGTTLPDRIDLLPTFAIDPVPIPAAIMAVIEDQLGQRANRAADDILARRPPRFTCTTILPIANNMDPVTALMTLTSTMDNTVLPVQGPPGTGKTYITARAILNLVRLGKRVAVSSNSHEAIRNVLMACVDAMNSSDLGFTAVGVSLAHKCRKDDEPLSAPYDQIEAAYDNDEAVLFSASIVGGTAWLFSRPQMQGTFDYLFVDEAGQVSLANLIAMTNAARNVVLIGDPNQLPQVVQGAHPHPANLSCLDWMLGEDTTIAPDRGIFLPVTRRMHPDLCQYVSEQFYAGRVSAHDSTARQAIRASGLPSAGAFLVPVQHEGRAQDCPEEVEAIRRVIKDLLAGTWTDHSGKDAAIQASDVIVVAPYNVQVNALSDALPGIRVGTVDKFQGQEAAVALVSMTASSAEETSRGLDFLLARERLNVAVSRGKTLSLVFASPWLLQTPCSTVEQMRLVNALCALPVWSRPI